MFTLRSQWILSLRAFSRTGYLSCRTDDVLFLDLLGVTFRMFPPCTFNHVQEHMCLHVLVSENVAYVVFPSAQVS